MKNRTSNFFILILFCTSFLSYSQDDDSMILLKDDESKLIKFENHYFEALKYKAIGIETKAPIIAPLFVVFFQNNPNINTAKIPGLTTPVYS